MRWQTAEVPKTAAGMGRKARAHNGAGDVELIDPSVGFTFAGRTLAHLTREYPNKLDHVLNGPQDLKSPRALHPIFYGSFDWHSNVHGYWLLATLYRGVADLP